MIGNCYCLCLLPPLEWKEGIRTLFTLNTGPTGSKLNLTLKPPPGLLAFTVPEGTMQAAKWGNNQQSHPAVMPMNHKNDKHGTRVPNVHYLYSYLGSNQ